ncbi:arabinosyltransferase domain-containing protein [Nocardia seriolae]|uniref:arabinosyltransferase domain-containing protein n=1 Tax=Nocardia seriolae TaxID=37332 RepID=UPI00068B0FE5|nr:arabinosyltransferase domain-containing protein [Nocardia seriolae]GEM24215.1 arabinosyltransferase A [Nocardia seriolae NBRC 15557]MTJ60171.1 arabinosyltransferase [Nocardia seriolae]MTJ71778.1 arabinosyltransferase [Nocardia seriolae]MTJ85167.1 arabinosyltransferase [Nocardia seriolae]MTK29162.1 arabinosyltransferase [Nocardia seriolae]
MGSIESVLVRADSRAFHRIRLVALVSGLLGFLLAVITPILPVHQDRPTLHWPQGDTANVDAPLVSYVPLNLDVSLPCQVLRDLPTGTLFSTVPAASGQAESKGLVVKVTDEPEKGRTLSVLVRLIPLLSAPVSEIGDCTSITVHSDATETRVEFAGVNREDGTPFVGKVSGDTRPQVVGLFTDLNRDQLGNASATVNIDARFTSSPNWTKRAATIGAVVFTLIALFALHLLDTSDGRKPRRFVPAHWWRVRLADVAVIGTLLVWHVIGANTSDDGYILNMARASKDSGYMANYYRWFGVAEAPFGWPHEVLAWMTRISDSSPWMRLPALLAGITCWLVISREVLPRLGSRVRRDNIAIWTAGLVFLAAWMPYDNGLRPEPLIAAGALLTWCSIERSIATGRLLPAAVGVLIAAFSLAAGPTGLICIAALIAGARPVLMVIIKRAEGPGSWLLRYGALLAPGVAAGTLVLVVVFADQTLASVMEATRVRTLIGPNVAWFDERTRWDSLLTLSPDGSLARRFGILAMLLCLGVCVMVMLRKNGRIPGTSRGPSARILGIIFMSLFLMMFTPTKWTHHFGVYAGLAGSVAALTAVAVGVNGIRSPRNRTLFTAAVFFLLAITFTGPNGWWYVSSYGVPWFDKAPLIAGKGFSTLFLGLAVLCLLVAAYQHFREPYAPPKPVRGFDKFASMPLTVAAAALVLFEVLSLAKAAVGQYPAYSIAESNLRALKGDSCALANEVLVETDTADSLLHPWTGSDADGLAAENTGFTPNGVASDLTADAEETVTGGANSVNDSKSGNKTSKTTGAGTGGGKSEEVGINGSSVALPFGLDPAKTPVMGSYTDGEQQVSKLTTQWYNAEKLNSVRNDPAYKVLIVTAAGRIKSIDKDGVETYGQDLFVEYGTRDAQGNVTNTGKIRPIDIGPSPSWRNLRVPLDQIPAGANAIRLVLNDADITPRQWLAVTPPRLPKLETLNSLVGDRAPVLEDWHVGLAFPCQRPFDHHDGVAEVPEWRILPDRVGQDASNAWQDDIGGGPLGWTGLLLEAETRPSYLNHDWRRDWGALEQFTPYVPNANTKPTLDVTVQTRSGLSKDAPIKVK